MTEKTLKKSDPPAITTSMVRAERHYRFTDRELVRFALFDEGPNVAVFFQLLRESPALVARFRQVKFELMMGIRPELQAYLKTAGNGAVRKKRNRRCIARHRLVRKGRSYCFIGNSSIKSVVGITDRPKKEKIQYTQGRFKQKIH